MPVMKYVGEGERVFPTLGVTVKKGDTFDAPEGFSAPDVESTTTSKKPASTPSAPSDTTEGE